MANPWDFLTEWVREHLNATGYDDEPTAKSLAGGCLEAAKQAGVSAAAVIKAAGGNLVTFMLHELNGAADREVKRLADKD